jgi:hypothetical protein
VLKRPKVNYQASKCHYESKTLSQREFHYYKKFRVNSGTSRGLPQIGRMLSAMGISGNSGLFHQEQGIGSKRSSRLDSSVEQEETWEKIREGHCNVGKYWG